MKYILATDSFKGCMSSAEVENIIAGVLEAKGIDTLCLPMSDGGDGMLAAFTAATGGTLEPVYIHDLMMRRTDAHYGVTPDGTAIVEVAQACGLSLIKEEERNPMRATTYGVGELLSRAIKRGCRNFIIGLGGTATSDAGIGMIKALVDIFARGKNFDEALKTELGECRFTLACDVDNPLCGENGAAHVYGPQKGATPEMVAQLDRRAQVDIDNAKLSYENALKGMQTQYANAVNDLANNQRNFSKQRDNYLLAEDIYKVTSDRYREGIASMTEVLQDEMSMSDAQNNYLTAHFNYQVANLTLLKLTGQLEKLTK